MSSKTGPNAEGLLFFPIIKRRKQNPKHPLAVPLLNLISL
jgi:hypothetical protein